MPVLYKNVPLAIQRDQQLPLCTNGKSCIETKCVVKNIADKRQLQINSFQRLITWYNTTDNSTYAVAFNYSKKRKQGSVWEGNVFIWYSHGWNCLG